MDTTVQPPQENLELLADSRGLTIRSHWFRPSVWFVLFFAFGQLLQADNWSEWRGADGDGFSDESTAPLKWSDRQNVLWKAELPAPGNSSPIVFGDRVFITCANDDGTERSLMAFNRKSGALLWKRSKEHLEPDPTHPTNPWCAASPATDGESVFTWDGSVGAAAYDYSGKLLWQRDLGAFVHQWGHGSSPRLYKDMVIIFGGPGPRVLLTALDKKTGETIWEKNLSHIGSEPEELIGSFATPFIWQNGKRTELLLPLPGYLASFDPDTGKEIWRCDGLGPLAYSDAMVGQGVILAFSGFKGPSFGMRVPGESERGNLTKSHRIWLNGVSEQRVGSGVIVGDRFYLCGRKGPLKCGDIKTGEILWIHDLGEQAWGAISHVQNRLYLTDQTGVTHIFKPGDRFDPIEQNTLAKEDRGNATIAFSDGQLFLRTHSHLYAIEDAR
ncbi:MAG: outer membrane protein assembly factor BamB [Candidatus Pelagisphaera sp.]|jgi:outer membrane protein assembly factor BamB